MNDIGRCVLMRIQSPTATATANPADTNMLLWESEISRAAERALWQGFILLSNIFTQCLIPSIQTMPLAWFVLLSTYFTHSLIPVLYTIPVFTR